MTTDFIRRQVQRIKKKYRETDPIRLCEALGILINYYPMGNTNYACKGFFMIQSRISAITINSDLAPEIQRIVAAHELGHAILHARSAGIKTFHDFELFDRTSSMEYEANIFAAEFLLSDDDVLEQLNSDTSFFGAASCLNVPAELLDFKFRMMKRNGYKLVDPPLMSCGDFMKNMPTNIY